MRLIYDISLVVHILAAIALVGSMWFNAFVLDPALQRVPPAHAATVADRIGGALAIIGPTTLVLLGVSGLIRLWYPGFLPLMIQGNFATSMSGGSLWLMILSWFVLVFTGTLSGIWYARVFSRKLPYSAGLRELEERRAKQERLSTRQARLNYLNAGLGTLAALGGALFRIS
jgi:hypothetical protein